MVAPEDKAVILPHVPPNEAIHGKVQTAMVEECSSLPLFAVELAADWRTSVEIAQRVLRNVKLILMAT
jgi:hypothetical protein